MILPLQPLGIRRTNAINSWIEIKSLTLGQARQIDEASVRSVAGVKGSEHLLGAPMRATLCEFRGGAAGPRSSRTIYTPWLPRRCQASSPGSTVA